MASRSRALRALSLLAARAPAEAARAQPTVQQLFLAGAAARGPLAAAAAAAWRGFAAAAPGPDAQPPSDAAGAAAGAAEPPGGGGGVEGESVAAAELPQMPHGGDEDPLAYAYRLSKAEGNPFGLPPLAELQAFDPDAEERSQRRENERVKQEQVAASRVRSVDAQGRAYATGKRKEAIARVWLSPGDGAVLVNGRALDVYFAEPGWRSAALYPFLATGTLGAFDAAVHVHGGGSSGQAQAVRHGIAKALQCWEPALRPALRAEGLLTRDPRVVERKKPGKPKARKSFQWVKR